MPTITLVGYTKFNNEVAHDLTGWASDPKGTDGANLTEFAGRACYQSWERPNPKTAANADYIRHIQEVGHNSVMEHGSATFYVQGVSRSLTHELVRHRHASYSQESQRFVKLGADLEPVIPPLYRDNWEWDDAKRATEGTSETQGILEDIWQRTVTAYDQLAEIWDAKLAREGVTGTEARKRSREAARCVLPNMTPTAITITANHTAWRHFLLMRGSWHADAEIRDLALHLHSWLTELEPALYQDIVIRYRKGKDEEPYLTKIENHNKGVPA